MHVLKKLHIVLSNVFCIISGNIYNSRGIVFKNSVTLRTSIIEDMDRQQKNKLLVVRANFPVGRNCGNFQC